jgi:hypothetical protein
MASHQTDDVAALIYDTESAGQFVCEATDLPLKTVMAILEARDLLHAAMGLCEAQVEPRILQGLRHKHLDLITEQTVQERFLSWEAEVTFLTRETSQPVSTICAVLAADSRFMSALGFSDDDGSGYLALAEQWQVQGAPTKSGSPS